MFVSFFSKEGGTEAQRAKMSLFTIYTPVTQEDTQVLLWAV